MRKLRTHIAQMVSQCDYLKVRPRACVAGGEGVVLPVVPMAEGMTRQGCRPVTFVCYHGLPHQWPVVFSLIVILLSLSIPGYTQDTTSAPESVPVLARPPASSQELLLAPVPAQFDWMQRQVRPNPLLETLLAYQDRPPQLFMSATLAEEYSDNFSQRGGGDDGSDEYRTLLNVGTAYRLESGPSFVSLANSLSANYQARAEESDIGFANLSLNVGHQISRLALALSESLIHDDDSGQASESELRRGRRNYLRNRISPQMRYSFSRLTAMAMAYTNTIVRSEGGVDADDSISHAVDASLQHRFSRLFTGEAEYTFTTTNSDGGADTESHRAAVDFGYLLDRRTSLVFQLFGLITDRSAGGDDSVSYGTSVGLRRQFSSFLGAFVSLGTTVLDREDRDARVFLTWQAALDGALTLDRRTSLSLTSQQSIGDTSNDIDNVGMVLRQTVTLSLNHAFTQALLTSLYVNFTRIEQLEDSVGTSESVQGRDDNVWRAGVRASYALSRVMSLSLAYLYQRRDSNQGGGDFDENRVTLALSSGFPVF